MGKSDLRKMLDRRMGIADVREVLRLVESTDCHNLKEVLYELSFDEDERVAANALWVLCNFDADSNEWLYAKLDDLIDRVLHENDVRKIRLLLNLLLLQPYEKENLRSDFIDFCVGGISACSMPYAIRALCMKLAYEQMKFYPELLAELKMVLNMLEQEPLSPGVASAKRQILKKMKKQENRF